MKTMNFKTEEDFQGEPQTGWVEKTESCDRTTGWTEEISPYNCKIGWAVET